MQHLDEGTIHAWLDGALDATETREVEAHLAQCPTCSASVAEARGLIAASSRILTALDDVPAGVLPKQAPRPAAKAPKRQWRAAPWVSAIAAALVLAVGISTWSRGGRMAPEQKADVATAPALKDERALQSRADTVARVAETQQGPVEIKAVAVRERSNVAARNPVTAPPAAVAADLSKRRDVANEGRTLSRAADAALPPTAVTGAGVRSEQLAAAAAPEPVKRSVSDSTRLRAPGMKREEVVADKVAAKAGEREPVETDALQLAGCYRLDAETNRYQGVAGGVAAAVSGERRAAAQPRAAAPAPYAAPVPAQFVRLDTAQKPVGRSVVYSARSDSTVLGWWVRLGPDSAQVRLLSGVAVTVLGKNRVDCPER